MSKYLENKWSLVNAIKGMVWSLSRINDAFGTGFIVVFDEPYMSKDEIIVKLLDGPSDSGKVIATITASSALAGPAWVTEIVGQFELQLLELQDWGGPGGKQAAAQ